MDIGNTINTLFESYKAFRNTQPILSSMVTAEAAYSLGDIVSQLIVDKKVDWKKVRYTATLAPLYGICIEGLIQTGEFVGNHISENPLAKAALGPNLWGNLFNTFFFVNNTVGERTGYSIKKLLKNYIGIFSNIKKLGSNFKENYIDNIPGKEYAYSVAATLTAWNVILYFNYDLVPYEMRTPATLAVGFMWPAIVSLWSLKGRRKIVYDAVKKD